MTNAPPKEDKGIGGIFALPLAYLIPGMGHILLGERTRGVLFLVTIHLLFASGMLLAGVRAINPPDQPIWSYTQMLSGWPWFASRYAEQRVPRLDDLEREYNREFAEATGQHRSSGDTVEPVPDSRPMTEEERVEHQKKVRESQERRAKFFQDFSARHPYFNYSPKIQDIGAVYCGIAGMLNLLVMLDVLLRVSGNVRHPPEKEKEPASAEAGGAA